MKNAFSISWKIALGVAIFCWIGKEIFFDFVEVMGDLFGAIGMCIRSFFESAISGGTLAISLAVLVIYWKWKFLSWLGKKLVDEEVELQRKEKKETQS